jgi:hypothetical protein
VVDSIVADAPSNAAYARLRIRCYADNVLGGYADKASFYRTDSPPQGTPPSFTSIVRSPEYSEPNQPFNVVATVSDPDNDIVACSLYYSLNSGSFQGIGPDSSRNNSYYFGIPGQNSGFFVRYYLLAKDQYHTVFSDTFGFQVGFFPFLYISKMIIWSKSSENSYMVPHIHWIAATTKFITVQLLSIP